MNFNDFDYLGPQVNLTYNSSSNVKTKFGASISLLIFSILIALIFAFGQDFFKRKNPSIVKESINPDVHKNWTIKNIGEFINPVRIEDEHMNPLDNFDILYISMQYFQYKRGVDRLWKVHNETEVALKPCPIEDEFLKRNLNSVNIKGFLCPNLIGHNIGGSWDANSDYVSYLKFNIKECSTGKKNIYGKECSSNEAEKKKYFSNTVLFTTMAQTSQLTPSNYTFGLSKSLKYITAELDVNLSKDYYYYFAENEIQNDYGWIFPTSSSQKVISLQSQSFGVQTRSGKRNDNIIGSMYIYFIKDHDLYLRTYSKIFNYKFVW